MMADAWRRDAECGVGLRLVGNTSYLLSWLYCAVRSVRYVWPLVHLSLRCCRTKVPS